MSKESKFEHVYVEEVPEGNYAVIYMNRPDKLNAIQVKTCREISEALEPFSSNKKVRCIVLRGTKNITKKPSFSVGADLSGDIPFKGFKNIPAHIAQTSFLMHKYINMLEDFNKPVIAAVDGYALGGGCELTLACDLVIATRRSEFGFPEIKRGLFPGAGGATKMARRIGLNRATEMIYLGRHYSAEIMQNWGYVNFLTNEGEEFENLVNEIATTLGNSATTGLIMAKKCLKFGTTVPEKVGLVIEELGLGVNSASSDLMEGFKAFAQRRDPKFTGGL